MAAAVVRFALPPRVGRTETPDIDKVGDEIVSEA
jgi:hypothetical protein